MKMNYRHLTTGEIAQLERQLCTASDWDRVLVSEAFTPDHVFHSRFTGDIRLGVFEGEFSLAGGMKKHAGLYRVTLHNVEVGESTVMAAQVGVAGSTKIGKYNMVGGQVGFAGHITVGDKNGIGAQTGVDNSIGSGGKWLGAPVQPAMEFARQVVYLKRIGEMYSDIKDLKKKINN